MMPEYAPFKTWIPVTSSNVKKVWYDPEKEQLLIAYQPDGQRERRYAYGGVPAHVFLALLDAPSKGKYIAKHIKPSYAYTEI